MWIGDKDTVEHMLFLAARGDVSGDPIQAFNHAHGGGGTGSADTATGYSADVWQHAAAVFEAVDDRTAYINGVGTQDTGSGPNAPTQWDRMTIGWLGDSSPNYSSGVDIADPGIWLAALTSNEILALVRGARSDQVRQQSLAWNPQILGVSPEPDWSGSKRNVTVTGTTIGNGPPVIPYSARFWGHGPLIEVAAAAEYLPLDLAHTPQHQSLMAH